MLISSSIPSLQSKASNRMIVQTRTPSSGNLEGSKFQLSRVSIAWVRVSSSIIGEVLEREMVRACWRRIDGAGSPGSQVVVDGALGLGVHVTQKLGISGTSVARSLGRHGEMRNGENPYMASLISSSSQPPQPEPQPCPPARARARPPVSTLLRRIGPASYMCLEGRGIWAVVV